MNTDKFIWEEGDIAIEGEGGRKERQHAEAEKTSEPVVTEQDSASHTIGRLIDTSTTYEHFDKAGRS